MTQVITSLEQGVELATDTLSKIRAAGGSGAALAGGFLRDITAGIQPKDMDFYLSSSRAGIATDVANISQALGVPFVPMGNGEYEGGLAVFESVYPEDSDAFPVQLIFTPRGQEHPLSFDIALCEQYMFNPGNGITRSSGANRDIENRTLTIRRTTDSYSDDALGYNDARRREMFPIFLNHLRRVMEKFPDYTPVLATNFLSTSHGLWTYNRLVEEQIFGDPRTLFPAQGQVAGGDEVRLQDRAEVGQLVGEAIDILAVDDEAAAGGVQDPAQVQPRPIGANPWGNTRGFRANAALDTLLQQVAAAQATQALRNLNGLRGTTN